MLFTKKVRIIIKFGKRLADSLTLESIDTRVEGDEEHFTIKGKFLKPGNKNADE